MNLLIPAAIFPLLFAFHVKAENITIVLGDGPPYIYEHQGSLRDPNPGFSVELVTAAFRLSDISVQYQIKPFLRQLGSVRNGTSHGMIGLVESDAPDFIYPNNAVGMAKDCFYTLIDSNWKYDRPEGLEAIHLAIVNGYTYGEIDHYLSNANPSDITRIKAEDGIAATRMIRLLSIGRIDAFIESHLVIRQHLINDNNIKVVEAGCLRPKEVKIGFTPNVAQSKVLAEKFDFGMNSLRRTGEMKRILMRYGVEDWK